LANYNKTRIEIGHQHDRWIGLKEVWWKCKHGCHCACSSEIGTCLINDARRQAAHKNQGIYTFFLSNLAKQRFILMSWKYILTFNAKKKKLSKSITKINDIIQLLPALKVNIIIVHPRDVAFPQALARGKTTSQGLTIMMFTASAGNNCFIIPKLYLQ
jgi:hypothetical protein